MKIYTCSTVGCSEIKINLKKVEKHNKDKCMNQSNTLQRKNNENQQMQFFFNLRRKTTC